MTYINDPRINPDAARAILDHNASTCSASDSNIGKPQRFLRPSHVSAGDNPQHLIEPDVDGGCLACWMSWCGPRPAPRRQVLVYETPHVSFPDEVNLPDRYRPYLWRM